MKRRNLLIAVAAILVMFAVAACSESVAPEDRLGTITFDNNTSRAVGTVVTYSNEVENMVWLYKATKLDDGYTTGQTSGFVAVAEPTSATDNGNTTYTAVKGLSGKTLNNNFSYGLWKIELQGFKVENVTASNTGVAIKDNASAEYTATIDSFLVDSGANYAKAEIKLGENPETTIVFDTVNGISFKADNIKADSVFTLEVTDNKGTVTVGTGTNDVVKADKSVTFKNLTYKLNDNTDITGEHEMKFVLTQKLSGIGNTSITAARYTLKFNVQPGTTTTISGTLLKNDETGTIQINSIQDVPELKLSKVMPVEITEGTTDVATVSQETKINYGDLEVVYPKGTVISTEEGSVEGSSSDAKIGFEYKTTSDQTGIKIEATEAKMTFELSLSASTSDETGKKNEKLITIKKFIGKGLTISTIYHGGTQIDKLTSTSATVPTDKESYYYDSDGYLTLYVFHASEFNIITKGAVATVGDKKYYSLSEAITDVSEGGTVTLLSNVTVDSTITIKDKNITLDLKNKVVSFKENGSITLSADKVVTVENSTASQTSLINEVEVRSFSGTERSYHTLLDSALKAVKDGGTVTLLKDNVPLSNDVAVSVTFTLDLNSKTVTASGKYVIVEDGTLTVTNKVNEQSEFICGISGANGTYTVGAARIGGTCYASLKGAIEAANDNDTVTLLSNTTLTETATVSKSITLDLDNKVVTVSDGAYVLVADGTLTVENKEAGQSEFIVGIKGDGESKTYTAGVARIGINCYSTFKEAVENAENGATVDLLKDVNLNLSSVTANEAAITINKSLTINGNSHKFYDVSTTVNSKVQIVKVSELPENQSVTLKNLEITATASWANAKGLYIENSKKAEVTLDNVTVSLPDYYAINIFKSDGMKLKIENNSVIKGWAAIYNRSNSITVEAEDSTFKGTNNHSGGSDDFATLIVAEYYRHNDIDSSGNSMTFTNCTFTAENAGESIAKQYIADLRSPCNNTLTLYNCTLNASGDTMKITVCTEATRDTYTAGKDDGKANTVYINNEDKISDTETVSKYKLSYNGAYKSDFID